MIALRKLFQVFGRGTLEFLHPENRKILAYIRDCDFPDGHSETILCVANLSRFAQPVSLDLTKYTGRQPVEMLGYVPFPEVTTQPYPLTLAPYSFLWLELQAAPAKPIAASLPEAVTPDSAPLTLATLLAEPWLPRIEALLPNYIAQQRWFGGKSKTITSTRIASASPIVPGESVTALIELSYAGDTKDLYQLPLALLPESQAAAIKAAAPHAIIATLTQPGAPMVLFDATASNTFRSALLNLIATNPGAPRLDSESSAGASDLTAAHATTLNPADLLHLPSRLASTEQSNTSILYGDAAILKLFRRLSPTQNPDVEITRFLTETAHFPYTPAYLGDIHRTQDDTTLAFLQTFAPNQGDGWSWTLDELARFYESVANCPAPSSPTDLLDHASLYLDAAALIGHRTAELHLALAASSTDPAFAPVTTTAADLADDRNRIDEQTVSALTALQAALPTLPPDIAPLASNLLASRAKLTAHAHSLSAEPSSYGQRIRIHGDYHLGQLLRVRSGFLIVDFEGEPAKTLAVRRQKQSPLRDVAGMLRSFSYAARSALNTFTQQRHPEKRSTLEPWAAAWENAASNAFLTAYRQTLAGTPLATAARNQNMLSALLLEKALYELLYELNNRPTWLSIPLSGILGLVQGAS
jgi:maltose alpha-D-glucosyltransferase/alpha-amylase